ncbi:MAG: cation:dicarboxylase symporter family transporter [Gemmatimonadetes bacterium]|nr:cation:dicarboxylase symporter family transporter [Gemmatimonadota bacterium]NIV82645.1 cation:dicarboxylase symporter family transporter [Gemmatimonadota bacterium]NIY39320.1 cation:dicarboxylase symporter family transporter [Gemmatimonadota bacterium]
MLGFLRSLTEVMYRLTGYVMAVAPLGVLGATAAVVAQQGGAAMAIFAKLALAVGIGLGALLLVLYPAIAVLFRIPYLRLVGAVKEAAIIAFATASSAAALPEAMAELEEWGVPRSTVGFVFPTGLTFNLAGSTVYLGIAAVFVLQMGETTLGMAAFGQLFVILFIASKGVPQVPRGSFVVLAAALATFGAPDQAIAAGIGILLGLDALLDMARTGTNVIGNCLATAVIARWEGQLEGRTLRATADPAPGAPTSEPSLE